MRSMRIPGLLAIPVIAVPLAAQNARLTGYDWGAPPSAPSTTRLGDRTEAIMERVIRGQFEELSDGVAYYELFHMRLFLGDQKAVESNSTVELATGHIAEVKRIEARSIAPDGTVHELTKDAFKRSTDERDGSSMLYFAFEGLVPGSMVEYIFLGRQRPEMRGALTRLQFSYPVLHTSYELQVPVGWEYVFKGYNGAPLPAVDTTDAELLRHHIELHDVPAMDPERHTDVNTHGMYLVGKLDAVPSRNVRNYSSYTNAARFYNGNIYPPLEKGTRKALAAVLRDAKLSFARDEEDRIRTLDDHIRGTFRLAETGSGKLDDLDEVLRTGNANSTGFHRLYANLFREAGIDHQLVVTCDRTNAPFDSDFPAYNYLNDLCFYFPAIDKYLDPTHLGLGLGYLATENMGTHGLFVKNVVVNEVPTGIGSVKYIQELPAEASRNDLDIRVSFTADVAECTVEVSNALTGYNATYMQNYWSFLDEKQRNDLFTEQFSHLLEGATSKELTAEHGEHKYFGVKPFTLKGTVTTPMLCGRAGQDVLFKVGELIGPQSEMYAEKDRKLPVDEDYNRSYDRNISIALPPGWKAVDINGLNMHKKLEMDGKVLAEFRSTAVLEGDTIKVRAIEDYRSIHYPLERFEEYRAVINAAADFNKQAILLSKAD